MLILCKGTRYKAQACPAEVYVGGGTRKAQGSRPKAQGTRKIQDLRFKNQDPDAVLSGAEGPHGVSRAHERASDESRKKHS